MSIPWSWNASDSSPFLGDLADELPLAQPAQVLALNRYRTGGFSPVGDLVAAHLFGHLFRVRWIAQPPAEHMGAVSEDDLPHSLGQHRGRLAQEVHFGAELAQFLHDHLGLGFKHRRVGLELVQEQMIWSDLPVG